MLDPQRSEALLEEVSELYAIVLRIARRVHEGDEPMTATQRLALIEIAAAGPLRPNILARRMETTPATVTRSIDALEELGFVRRCNTLDDRRGVLVAPTPRGKRWADRRRRMVLEALSQVPPSAASDRLVSDLGKLNAALRVSTGHDDVSRGALLAPLG